MGSVMPRIQPLDTNEVAPELTDLIAQAQARLPQFLNQILTLSHHPPIANDLVTMYLGFQENSVVDRRYIELAVLTVSYLNRCSYCVSHHAPLGLDSGLSAEAMAALEAGEVADSPHFSDADQAVVAYATQMTTDARRVSSALFGQLQEHFNEQQIVEITVRTGLANFFNRLNDALQIEIEPGVEPLLVDETERPD